MTFTQFKETERQRADKSQGQDLNLGKQAVKQWGQWGTWEWLEGGHSLGGSQWGTAGAFKHGSDMTGFIKF